jgi:hypothetical protein
MIAQRPEISLPGRAPQSMLSLSPRNVVSLREGLWERAMLNWPGRAPAVAQGSPAFLRGLDGECGCSGISGLGDLGQLTTMRILGVGLPTLALVGLGAWLLLRRRSPKVRRRKARVLRAKTAYQLAQLAA